MVDLQDVAEQTDNDTGQRKAEKKVNCPDRSAEIQRATPITSERPAGRQ